MFTLNNFNELQYNPSDIKPCIMHVWSKIYFSRFYFHDILSFECGRTLMSSLLINTKCHWKIVQSNISYVCFKLQILFTRLTRHDTNSCTNMHIMCIYCWFLCVIMWCYIDVTDVILIDILSLICFARNGLLITSHILGFTFYATFLWEIHSFKTSQR